MLNPIVSTSPISKLTARIVEAAWLADCNTQEASTGETESLPPSGVCPCPKVYHWHLTTCYDTADVLVGSAHEQSSHAPAVKASWRFPGKALQSSEE